MKKNTIFLNPSYIKPINAAFLYILLSGYVFSMVESWDHKLHKINLIIFAYDLL